MPIEDTNMSWTQQNYATYILVDERANIAQLEKKMFSIIKDYVLPAQRERGRDAAYINILENVDYTLQPITDIHLKSDITMEDGLKHGDIRFVWIFAAIAGFILLLAVINFINLSTAKSANRAKEVGLRKTIGAFRSNLVAHFFNRIGIVQLSFLYTWRTVGLGLTALLQYHRGKVHNHPLDFMDVRAYNVDFRFDYWYYGRFVSRVLSIRL